MIQPVSAFSPRAEFRGSSGTYGGSAFSETTKHRIALINAGGITAATGGLTTLVARGHTSSWASALALGVCGALLSLFFMTPQLVKSKNAANNSISNHPAAKEDSQKILSSIKDFFKPVKKNIQMRA